MNDTKYSTPPSTPPCTPHCTPIYEQETDHEEERTMEFRSLSTKTTLSNECVFKPIHHEPSEQRWNDEFEDREPEPSPLSLPSSTLTSSSPSDSIESFDTSDERPSQTWCSCRTRKGSRKRSRISWLRGLF